MQYEDANVHEEGAKLGKIRTSMSHVITKLPLVHVRGAKERENESLVLESEAQELHKPAGPAIMVERILTSEADFGRRCRKLRGGNEVQDGLQGSERNKAELRAVQLQQGEQRITPGKRHEEMKVQVDLVSKDWKKEVPSKEKEGPLSMPKWKLLHMRTPRSDSPTVQKVRQFF